jgi:hypothetical protein
VLKYASGGVQDTFIHVGKNADAPNFTARGFSIDGTNQTLPGVDGIENVKSACGVLIDGETNDVSDSLTEDLHIRKVKNEGIGHWGRSGGTDNLLRSKARNCVLEDIRFRALHPHNSHTVSVVGCTFVNMTHADHETTVRHSDIIDDCRFHNCNGTRVIYGSDNGCLITNSVFTDCDTIHINSWRNNFDRVDSCAFIGGSYSGGTIKTDYQGIAVTDCSFYDIPRYAIDIQNTETTFADNTIINPSQSQSGWQAILVSAADAEIRGNLVKCPSSTTYSDGVQLNSTGGGHTIKNNTFRGFTGSAVDFNGNTAFQVVDNTPTVTSDVRSTMDATDGAKGYHDGTNSNTYGPAFYDGDAAAPKSLVDGTTIS